MPKKSDKGLDGQPAVPVHATDHFTCRIDHDLHLALAEVAADMSGVAIKVKSSGAGYELLCRGLAAYWKGRAVPSKSADVLERLALPKKANITRV